MKRLLVMREVAAMLGVSRHAIGEFVRSGKLDVVRLPGKQRDYFTREGVERFIEAERRLAAEEEVRPKKPGWIYIVAIINNGPTKIGLTFDEDPLRRVEQIRKGLPYEIEIIGFKWAEDAPTTEAQLHADFSGKRLRGEWFDLAGRDHDRIHKKYQFLKQPVFEEEMLRRLHAVGASS